MNTPTPFAESRDLRGEPEARTLTDAQKYDRGLLVHPDGQVCADCRHFKRTCEWLLSYSGRERTCDWFPSKFVAIAAATNDDAGAARPAREGG